MTRKVILIDVIGEIKAAQDIGSKFEKDSYLGSWWSGYERAMTYLLDKYAKDGEKLGDWTIKYK